MAIKLYCTFLKLCIMIFERAKLRFLHIKCINKCFYAVGWFICQTVFRVDKLLFYRIRDLTFHGGRAFHTASADFIIAVEVGVFVSGCLDVISFITETLLDN